MVISFKLETDESILKEKVIRSFEKYNVDYVVANILNQIRTKVQFYRNHSEFSRVELKRGEE